MARGARLGQHFLTGLWAAAKLAQAVGVREGETIVEIGPGTGALTRELLKTGASVVAVEKDETLVMGLRKLFAAELETGTLRLIEGDVRDVNPETEIPGPYVVAANIPYYITGEILRAFLETLHQPRALALLVQKEVAERIVGSRRLPAGRQGKESILSLSVKAYGTPSIVAKVARGNFSPPPSVDSAILLIGRVSKDFFKGIDERTFFSVVRAGFSSKRKFLLNNLSSKFGKRFAAYALEEAGLDEKVRAEDVALPQWRELCRVLTSRESE